MKDLPKVENKPSPEEINRMDVKMLNGKMVAEFYYTNRLVAWGVIDHPENFCEVVDAYRKWKLDNF